MSELGRFKQILFVAVLLALLLVVLRVRAAELNEVLVDPTYPLFGVTGGTDEVTGAPATAPARYRLGSILVRGDASVAVINGQRVRAGDSIGNARVRAIGPTSVTLEVEGRTETLQLYENAVKTLVKGDER